MSREPLSAVVTTMNNAATLERCLCSVAWVDEIIVLDSGSTDETLAIANRYGCRIFSEPFKGYGAQKQSAIDKAAHDWVLLLDADESLTLPARTLIEQALIAPTATGYRLPRRELMFWTFQHRYSSINTHLRLFNRRYGHLNQVPIHAAPVVNGLVRNLPAELLHYGEPDIHTKIEKINAYSTGMVDYKRERGQRFAQLRMIVYPPLFFLRQFLIKRYFLNGWAGFISSVIGAFYVFSKYAKLYESKYRETHKPDPH